MKISNSRWDLYKDTNGEWHIRETTKRNTGNIMELQNKRNAELLETKLDDLLYEVDELRKVIDLKKSTTLTLQEQEVLKKLESGLFHEKLTEAFNLTVQMVNERKNEESV